MRKIISMAVSFIMFAFGATMMFIYLNNHNNAVRSNVNTVNTVSATVAPTVVPTPTEAPTLPVATVTPFVPLFTTTPATTSAPVAVETTPEEISSLEVSKKTIVTDEDGKSRQMMIYYADLKKVDYEEIIIESWNGVHLIINNKGVVGEVFGREDKANNPKTTTKVGEVKNFFINGLIKSNRVEEGYALPNTEMETNLTNIMFVQIIGEENYRLVVAGNSRAGGNGGNADPTATATQKPTPEATKESGGDNSQTQKPVFPNPEATKEPGGNNSGFDEATKKPIGGIEAGGENNDLSKVNSDDGNSSLNVTEETVESSVSSNDSESTGNSSFESVEDCDGSNSGLPVPEDF